MLARLFILMIAAVCILGIAGCQSADPNKVATCNRANATLDDPEMQDCYLYDRAAHQRMVDKKQTEFRKRLDAIEAGAKLHPEKYNRPRDPGMVCRGSVYGNYARMNCY